MSTCIVERFQTLSRQGEKERGVPFVTAILTLEGFKTCDQAKVGEPVFAYDEATQQLQLVPLQGVKVYRSEPILRLANNHAFEAFVSGRHTWATEYRTRYRVQSGEVRQNDKREMVQTRDLKNHQKIIVAAPWRGEAAVPLEVDIDTALLMGFAVTDGGWKRTTPGSRYRLTISQAKRKQLKILREITAGRAAERQNRKAGQYAKGEMASYDFQFSADETEALLRALGVEHPHELVHAIARQPVEARGALLRGIMLGDGDIRGVLGQPENKLWVLEVFQVLAALAGKAVGLIKERDFGTGARFFTQRLRKTNRVHVSNLVQEEWGHMDVWQPATAHGTSVVRFPNGLTTIIGTCRSPASLPALENKGVQRAASDFKG